jgi:hypothetical protein
MKTIIRWSKENTVLVVTPLTITLKIGTAFEDARIRDLLRVTSDILTNIINRDTTCYGHYQFTQGSVIIALSSNPEKPNSSDLKYRRSW